MSTYIDKEGKICMIRCTQGKKENWAMAVATGQCAWCGFDANDKPEPPEAA